jgi:hypothetical protein
MYMDKQAHRPFNPRRRWPAGAPGWSNLRGPAAPAVAGNIRAVLPIGRKRSRARAAG